MSNSTTDQIANDNESDAIIESDEQNDYVSSEEEWDDGTTKNQEQEAEPQFEEGPIKKKRRRYKPRTKTLTEKQQLKELERLDVEQSEEWRQYCFEYWKQGGPESYAKVNKLSQEEINQKRWHLNRGPISDSIGSYHLNGREATINQDETVQVEGRFDLQCEEGRQNWVSCSLQHDDGMEFIAKNQEEFDNHMKKRHLKFKCPICNEEFPTRKAWNNHKYQTKKHAKNIETKCHQCGECFASWELRREHVSKKKNKKCLIKCSAKKCSRRFVDFTLQQTHHKECRYQRRKVVHKFIFLRKDTDISQLLIPQIEQIQEIGVDTWKAEQSSYDLNELTKDDQETLIHLVDDTVKGYVTIRRRYERLRKFAEIIDLQVKSDYESKIFILIADLQKRLDRLEIPEIACWADLQAEKRLRCAKFWNSFDKELVQMVTNPRGSNKRLVLMTKRNINFWSSVVPRNHSAYKGPNYPVAKKLQARIDQLEHEGLYKLLDFKMRWQIRHSKKNKNLKAIKSDQEQTPDEIYNTISTKLLVDSIDILMDQTPFKEDWEKEADHNALENDFCAMISILNLPYSLTAPFITKMVEQQQLGYASAALVPEVNLKTRFCKGIVKSLGQEIKLGKVQFRGHEDGVFNGISLLILPTPELLNHLERKRKTLQLKDGSGIGQEESMHKDYGTQEWKTDIALRMLADGIGTNMVSRMAKLRREDVIELRNERLNSYLKDQEKSREYLQGYKFIIPYKE